MHEAFINWAEENKIVEIAGGLIATALDVYLVLMGAPTFTRGTPVLSPSQTGSYPIVPTEVIL